MKDSKGSRAVWCLGRLECKEISYWGLESFGFVGLQPFRV